LSVHVVAFFLFSAFAISGYLIGKHDDVSAGVNAKSLSPEERHVHRLIVNVVLGTDIAAGVLLLVYLIEHAPWHKTQMREHAYLSVLLAMVFSAPCIRWYDPAHGTIRRNYDELTHLMMASLVVRISSRMTSPERIAGFFRYRAKSDWLDKQRPQGSLRAMRTVTQLDELMSQLEKLQQGFSSKISDSAFNVILLCLFLLVEATTMLPGILLTHATVIIYVWWAVIWASLMKETFDRWCKIRPRQRQIDKIIHDVLKSRDTALLGCIVWELDLPSLMEVGTTSTTAMISEKALQLGCLGVVEKAIIVDALQKRGIRLWKEHQQTVADLLLSCTGADLTLLKNLIDTGGDYFNLYKLVYEDMTERKPRQAVQVHLREQSLLVRAANFGAAPQGTRGGIGIKILSDVDDTLYSSGGSFPAGCDKTFPKHRVYPGCLELFRVLVAHDSKQNADLANSASLVFLSARPHVYKSVMEDHSYAGFRALLKDKRLHSLPTLLPGNLAKGVCAMLTYCCRKTKAWRRVGEAKYNSFKKYAQLYLEYDYVFCGDNGQGDLLAGQHMVAESPELSGSESEGEEEQVNPNPRVLAVLIHEVMPDEQALALEPPKPAQRGEAWRAELARQRLFFHRTYLGAAAQLYEACPGLISAPALRQIAEEAVQNFEADVRYCEWSGDWSKYEEAFQEDHARVSRLLQKAGVELKQPVPVAELLPPHAISSASCCRQDSMSDNSEDQQLLV